MAGAPPPTEGTELTTDQRLPPSRLNSSAPGQPGWLAGVDNHLGAFLGHRGPAAAVMLAVVLAVVAVGVWLPRPAARAVIVLAVVTAAAIWIAEGLGGILTGGGTDPNSGLLLALLALAYWPLASHARTVARSEYRPEGA